MRKERARYCERGETTPTHALSLQPAPPLSRRLGRRPFPRRAIATHHRDVESAARHAVGDRVDREDDFLALEARHADDAAHGDAPLLALLERRFVLRLPGRDFADFQRTRSGRDAVL